MMVSRKNKAIFNRYLKKKKVIPIATKFCAMHEREAGLVE
jgi:hypothetical protein